MSKPFRVGFIGSGNMAAAIAGGIVHKTLYAADEIIMSNRSTEKLQALHKGLGVVAAKDNAEVAATAELIILAVKPQQFPAVAAEIRPVLKAGQVVVSIMAGLTLSGVKEALGEVAVVRVMPNTPAQIGCGMTAICADDQVPGALLAEVKRIFASVGETIVIDEQLMDAVSAVSGCGPAYFYQIIEAVADGGVMVGLPRAMAYQLAAQTMLGAAKMVLETGAHPGTLKDQVTSPGGTTIRAVQVLEQHGMRGALMEAVEAAYSKSQQLGENKKQ